MSSQLRQHRDQRLEQAILNGSFRQNPVFRRVIEGVRERGAALHLLAFLTKQSSHGSIAYATALCEMAKDLPEVSACHIRRRSTKSGSAPELLEELEEKLAAIGCGQIVDRVGRSLVLERDGNYEKVKQGCDAMMLGVRTAYGYC